MDVESPEHLERLRDLKPVKVALLQFHVEMPGRGVRFERSARNAAYWPHVEALHARQVTAMRADEGRSSLVVYGRDCWLISTLLAPRHDSPFALAVATADGVDADDIVTTLRSVCHDYGYGSTFFK